MAVFQQVDLLSMTASGGAQPTATFTLQNQTLLSRLTIWAISNGRTVNITLQPQINGQTYGASTAITTAIAKTTILTMGGGTSGSDVLIPASGFPNGRPIGTSGVDPFVFSVLVTNAAASAATVTIYAVGLDLVG